MAGHHRYHARDHVAHRRRHIFERNPAIVTQTIFFDPEATGRIIGFSTLNPVEEHTATRGDDVQEEEQPRTTQMAAADVTTSSRIKPTPTVTSDELEGITSTSRNSASPSASRSVGAANSYTLAGATGTRSSAASSSTASLGLATDSATSTGMSVGATAGLAGAGVVILIVVGFIAFIFYRRKSKQKKQEAYGNIEDEKAAAARGADGAQTPIPTVAVSQYDEKSIAPSITSERAPRVSLRPVTQFMPNLMGGATATGTTAVSGTSTLGVPAASAPGATYGGTDTAADAAAGGALGAAAAAGAVAAAAGAIAAGGVVMAANQPVGEPQQAHHQQAQLVRTLSRKEPPPALVLSNKSPLQPDVNGASPLLPPGEQRPSSLTPSAFTDSSVGVSPFAGSPAVPLSAGGNVSNGPVHRVQMAFDPTMGDELELREGQLVRIIHEYDDGWALCIRLDRSRQGVCPRTCLSQNPLKPRPPPGGAGPRGPPPRAGPGYPGPGPHQQAHAPHGFPSPLGHNSPGPGSFPPHAGGQPPRPQSPASRPQSPVVARPQSPVVSRPQSPAVRSQSPARTPGYHKPQYIPNSASRPSSPVTLVSAPSSPTTPTIVISPSFSRPSSPSSQSPTSPAVAPRPAIAPIHPSPLSIQTSTSDVEGGEPQQSAMSSSLVFHAM